jgi:2-aminoadipate transaminase
VAEYFAEGRWREYVESLSALYRERRDAMIEALERHFPPQCEWSRPKGGLFLWATLPHYIDTGDLLAKALRENVAFVPGAAAYADARTSSSMRLNFSASTPDEIQEGIRRIGQVIWEQVGLYETITGETAVVGGGAEGEEQPERLGAEGADVLPLRRREREEGRG